MRNASHRAPRTLLTGLGVSGLLLISGCTSALPEIQTSQTPGSPLNQLRIAPVTDLSAYEHRSATSVIEELESAPVSDRTSDLMATVHPDHLMLANRAGESLRLELPEDSFYLSIAPGTDLDRSCVFHSLTTCLGERPNTPVSITVTDASGVTLLHREARTGDNGHTGVWLPSGITGTVTVICEGITATRGFSTRADAPTCLPVS